PKGPLFANSSNELPSRSLGLLRCECGASDRNRRSAWAAQSFNLGIELLRKCVDDAGAKACFWLSKDAVRRANSVVRDRELPIRSENIVSNGDFPIFGPAVESMLDGIDDKFGDDQSNAFGIA